MQFIIDTAEALKVTDLEISELLSHVYVEAGFATKEVAASIFEPSLVRKRGEMFVARDKQTSALAGMVIVVPPKSDACVLAKDNEAEMHLLGVKQDYRGFGLGRLLVDTAVNYIIESGYTKVILCTQKPMKAAQHLYQTSGFSQTKEINRSGIDFLVYEKGL